MRFEELLVALADTAAIFAGFSGIAAHLGASSVATLMPLERFRFVNLLMTSMAACLLAFVPIVLSEFIADAALLWSSSSALLGLYAVVTFVVRNSGWRRLRGYRGSSARAWMRALTFAVLLCVALAQLANVLSWPFGRSAATYVAGIFGLLVLSGIQFMLLALDSTPQPSVNTENDGA